MAQVKGSRGLAVLAYSVKTHRTSGKVDYLSQQGGKLGESGDQETETRKAGRNSITEKFKCNMWEFELLP